MLQERYYLKFRVNCRDFYGEKGKYQVIRRNRSYKKHKKFEIYRGACVYGDSAHSRRFYFPILLLQQQGYRFQEILCSSDQRHHQYESKAQFYSKQCTGI